MRRFARLAGGLGLAVAAVVGPAAAQDRPAVVVTPGSAQVFHAALQRFADGSAVSRNRAEPFRRLIGQALEFSGAFRVTDPKAFLGPDATLALGREAPVCSDWTQIGADALLEGELVEDPERFSVEFRVWDTARCARLLHKRYTQAASVHPDHLARRIADDVVEAFLGVRGVSSTEMAFVSTRGGSPEVYVMDAAGGNQRPATANRSINKFPSWSPDGDSIVYTSYRVGNRPLLYLSSRGARRPGPLLERHSSLPQYRGVFDPTGRHVAVVMSPNGSSEIFAVRVDGRDLRRLTHNSSIDVSPSWSPDGRRLAFVSDRSGSPQVYVMDADGGNERRLTFQGSYNTGPAWSPDGLWIAYETRVGGQFDLWLIDPEGQVNVPLVSHPRSDEGPSWAPNSRKLAFSSTRRGRADIYVIDVTGDNLRRITQGQGDNTSPAWGPYPR